MTRARREDGSAALELVLVAPALLLLLGVIIAGGRLVGAHEALDTAAGDAARAASIARDPTDAQAAATQAATRSLTDQGVTCTRLTVTVDTTRFSPGGTVSVTLACSARLGTFAPTLSGSRRVSVHAASVLDPYRATFNMGSGP
jgi:Flp pilus assembly protein TadG